jgi:hypothetical protein
MATITYTSRVVETKQFLLDADLDSWVEPGTEYPADGLMLTADATRAIGGIPIRTGSISGIYCTYSGYIAGVKTPIELAAVDDPDSLSVTLYDPLTRVVADTWRAIITPGSGEDLYPGVFILCQDITEAGAPDYTITTSPGLYAIEIAYSVDVGGGVTFSQVIISGWIEILPETPS